MKNRLKVGQEISEAKLSEIQLESEKSVALDKALAHISATQKTEKQIREFLSKKGYLSAVADHVVEKMREYNFLNDGEYAESYVESAAKRKGSRLIRLELKSKGISDAEIDGALESLDEETEISTARGILDKYMRGKSFDRETLQKAYRYLMGKGFDYDVAKAALASLSVEEEE